MSGQEWQMGLFADPKLLTENADILSSLFASVKATDAEVILVPLRASDKSSYTPNTTPPHSMCGGVSLFAFGIKCSTRTGIPGCRYIGFTGIQMSTICARHCIFLPYMVLQTLEILVGVCSAFSIS